MSPRPVPTEFTHAGPGTPAQAWREDRRWDSVPPLTLRGVRHLVVVAAHPDDESLGAGGLVATAVGAGVPVSLVVATAGRAATPTRRRTRRPTSPSAGWARPARRPRPWDWTPRTT